MNDDGRWRTGCLDDLHRCHKHISPVTGPLAISLSRRTYVPLRGAAGVTASDEAIAGSRSCGAMGNAVCTYTVLDTHTRWRLVGPGPSCRADRSMSFRVGGTAVALIIVGLDDLHLYYTHIPPAVTGLLDLSLSRREYVP